MKQIHLLLILFLFFSGCSLMKKMMMNRMEKMSEKAYIMMPLCLVNILSTVEENERAQYFTDITKRVIEIGYNDLSTQDKVIFKQSVIISIEELN